MIKKEEVISFLWQHILLLVSLYVMTFGVAACVRSQLGSSVISTIPYVMASAGKMLDYIPGWTIGGYTIMMNAIFVVLQILILRRNFEWVKLFQLAIGFIFGMFIDLNMVLTQWMVSENILVNALVQIAGCTILGFGIAMEVKCGSVTMPGEGISIAIHKVTGWPFPKAKIRVDITLVVLAVLFCFLLLGSWKWEIVGIGTLFAMVYVGVTVRLFNKHLAWFDRLISEVKDYEECIRLTDRFLPFVDNWAVCDIMSPKVFAKHKEKLLAKIKTWSKSLHVYTCRFGIETLMSHYLDKDFKAEYLEIPASVRSKEYYVKMMVAWFFATALAKQWDQAIPYIEQNRLAPWTHNKTIQKTIESYRITPEQKEYLRTLKIK